jgi:hypothetical protein
MSSPATFDSLTVASKSDLDRLMKASPAPGLSDVVGFEFRGWNLEKSTEILRTRKFKKGFYGNPADGYAWGYNVPVQQNAKNEPWIATPSDENPKRYFFFKVLPSAIAEDPKYRDSLVVDYRKWPDYFPANPVRFTVDYLVFPAPGDRDLILGKSYWELGPLRPFLGYFILERHNASNFQPPAPS